MDSGVGKEYKAILQEPSVEPVYLPKQILSSLQRDLNITETQITSFLISLIEKTVSNHLAEQGKVFSASETEEIENDLKGLGYI